MEWNNKGTFLAVTQIKFVTENSYVIFLETVWNEMNGSTEKYAQFSF